MGAELEGEVMGKNPRLRGRVANNKGPKMASHIELVCHAAAALNSTHSLPRTGALGLSADPLASTNTLSTTTQLFLSKRDSRLP